MCSCTNCAFPAVHQQAPETWIIVHPQGMRSHIAIFNVPDDDPDLAREFLRASDRKLGSESEAEAYATALSRIQGATYSGEVIAP